MSEDKKASCCNIRAIMWWATLVVAVLAVPSFAIIVSTALPVKGISEVLVFILACWASTFLGMKLMQNPKMNETLNSRDKK